MKIFYIIVFLSMLIPENSFAQMRFNGKDVQISSFDLMIGKSNLYNKKLLQKNRSIVDNQNDILKKRKGRGNRRGSGDLGFLSYSRIGISIPDGSLAINANTGFFWQGMLETVIEDNFALGISFGYFVYPGAKVLDAYGNMNALELSYVMPLAATFKYFLLDDSFKPYIGADFGFMFAGIAGNKAVTKFGYTPRAGFLLSFADYYLFGIDVSGNVTGIGNSYNLGIQFGYVFGN